MALLTYEEPTGPMGAGSLFPSTRMENGVHADFVLSPTHHGGREIAADLSVGADVQ